MSTSASSPKRADRAMRTIAATAESLGAELKSLNVNRHYPMFEGGPETAVREEAGRWAKHSESR